MYLQKYKVSWKECILNVASWLFVKQKQVIYIWIFTKTTSVYSHSLFTLLQGVFLLQNNKYTCSQAIQNFNTTGNFFVKYTILKYLLKTSIYLHTLFKILHRIFLFIQKNTPYLYSFSVLQGAFPLKKS